MCTRPARVRGANEKDIQYFIKMYKKPLKVPLVKGDLGGSNINCAFLKILVETRLNRVSTAYL
ncbi:hypothetical protein NIES4071_27170 [Calothrix sp. NIES-4071]|nr:hypothetical protein NIES4071_27170 [Calothrix sp. NIES-4071]BAZ57039.1 hypothetical protein NIES4105_27110 [Calothrix sp. NIES-4105]